MSSTSRIAALPLALAFLLGACGDNVTCIFTTGCSGGTGAISDNPAVLPVDGQTIQDGPPTIERVAPSGNQNSGTTPVVLVFRESINPDTLEGAIQIAPVVDGEPRPAITGVAQALVADGRVLVLLPPTAAKLAAGDYSVRLSLDANVTDLTGQPLGLKAGSEVGKFTVATTPPAVPRLVATFPPDGATTQSETTEIVVVLDRPVRATSVNASSFDVRVEGVDPPNDPLPAALVLSGGAPEGDTRVFLYRSVDAQGVFDPLGTDVDVQLTLSPASNPISEEDNGVLLPATIDFHTLVFAPPLGASLLSDPSDAVGIANLTAGDPEELTIQVDLDGGQPNDSVDLLLFGHQRNADPAKRPLIALQRTVRLTGTAPIQLATFTREIIDMQLSSDPTDTRFQDGALSFAFRQRRGSAVSPVRLLDLDPNPDVIRDPLLDTVAPSVASLIGSGLSTAEFRSDQRDLCLAGLASEKMRSVEVTTPLGDNGTLAPVVGSSVAGLFLAAPVPAGILTDGTTTYSFVGHDAASNAAPTRTGTFTQFGALGPDAFTPGQSLSVDVFDADTLLPLGGAQVLVHSDQGNGTSFPFFQAETTLLDGHVTVGTAAAPSVGAILTVVKAGYDLFTLQGVPATRVSVPLRASNQAFARVAGAARSSNAAAILFLPDMDRRFDDSRRQVEFSRGFVGQAASTNAGSVTCAYGPESIRDDRLGAHSFYAGDFSQVEASFSAVQLLQAFALSVPLAPVASNQQQNADLEVPFLLIEPTVPPEEAAQALPPCVFTLDAGAGVDLLALFDDPATTGTPFISVETRMPGLPGCIAVAQGIAFDQGSSRWNVRAAQPGAISAGGSLGSDGIVDTDPFLRMELRDVHGNVAGTRPRLSTLQAGGAAPEFRALATASLLSPAAGAHTGGDEFTLALNHAIGDERAAGGLYRVELQDETGRGWTLWRVDPAGTGDVQVRVVDVADGAAVGLADGTLTALVSAFAWTNFAAESFLWSDIEREFELFSFAAPASFEKP